MLTATAVTRHYLASEYLWTAQECASQCRRLENALVTAPKHPATHPKHRSLAIMTIMSSVSFLEALVNEVYADAGETGPGRADALTPSCRAMMSEYWFDADRSAGALTKYQMALLFAGKQRFDKGANPFQDANVLVSMRNALMHFKPSWHDGLDPAGLERTLPLKFAKSRLLPGADSSPWLIWALAAPGADWAVTTARTFADTWMDQMALTRVYEVDGKAFEQQVVAGGL